MQTIQLDINPSFYSKNPIHLSQYDIIQGGARIELRDAGNPYTIPEGATVSIEGSKPDGTAFAYDDKCEIINENTVILSITQQMTAVSGRVVCELRIKQGDDNIGTCNFWLIIEKAPIPEDVDISDTEIPAYIDGARQQAEAAARSAAEAEEWAKKSEEWAKEDGVVTFAGRKGDVEPEAGDYTADQITYKTEDVAAALDGLEAQNKQAQSSISIIQTALTGMAGRIDEAEIDIQNNSDRVSRAQSSISIVASDLATLAGRVYEAEGGIQNNTDNITAAQSSISLIDTEVRRITGDLDAAEEDIASLQETSGQLIDQSTILLNQIEQAQEVGVKNILFCDRIMADSAGSSYSNYYGFRLDTDAQITDFYGIQVLGDEKNGYKIAAPYSSTYGRYIWLTDNLNLDDYVYAHDQSFIVSGYLGLEINDEWVEPSDTTSYLEVFYTDRDGIEKTQRVYKDDFEDYMRGTVKIRLVIAPNWGTTSISNVRNALFFMVRDGRISSGQYNPPASSNYVLTQKGSQGEKGSKKADWVGNWGSKNLWRAPSDLFTVAPSAGGAQLPTGYNLYLSRPTASAIRVQTTRPYTSTYGISIGQATLLDRGYPTSGGFLVTPVKVRIKGLPAITYTDGGTTKTVSPNSTTFWLRAYYRSVNGTTLSPYIYGDDVTIETTGNIGLRVEFSRGSYNFPNAALAAGVDLSPVVVVDDLDFDDVQSGPSFQPGEAQRLLQTPRVGINTLYNSRNSILTSDSLINWTNPNTEYTPGTRQDVGTYTPPIDMDIIVTVTKLDNTRPAFACWRQIIGNTAVYNDDCIYIPDFNSDFCNEGETMTNYNLSPPFSSSGGVIQQKLSKRFQAVANVAINVWGWNIKSVTLHAAYRS